MLFFKQAHLRALNSRQSPYTWDPKPHRAPLVWESAPSPSPDGEGFRPARSQPELAEGCWRGRAHGDAPPQASGLGVATQTSGVVIFYYCYQNNPFQINLKN